MQRLMLDDFHERSFSFKVLSRLNARSSTKVNNVAIAILLLLIKFLKPGRYDFWTNSKVVEFW